MTTRRDFLKHSALGAAGLTIGGLGFSTESYANIMGANEKIRVGIVLSLIHISEPTRPY